MNAAGWTWSADNQAFAAANVSGEDSRAGDRRAVQRCRARLSPAGFLQAAMQPQDPSLVQANVLSVSDATHARLEDYTVVVLNDVPMIPPLLRDRITQYARGGHGVWIILGPKTQRSTIEKDLASDALFLTAQVPRGDEPGRFTQRMSK